MYILQVVYSREGAKGDFISYVGGCEAACFCPLADHRHSVGMAHNNTGEESSHFHIGHPYYISDAPSHEKGGDISSL